MLIGIQLWTIFGAVMTQATQRWGGTNDYMPTSEQLIPVEYLLYWK